VKGHRSSEHYNSALGKAQEKVETWLAEHGGQNTGLLLWGVGNHGGGPSRVDLQKLAQLIEQRKDVQIRHSVPEDYFDGVDSSAWPVHRGDLNAWAVGCYTSQVRIKQMHRKLENQLYLTEKMATAAGLLGLCDYPAVDLEEVSRTLALAQFHDILPGSSVQTVEDYSLNLMGHGLELLTRLRARAFFALAAGQKTAAEGEIPILVYNPHPYPVEGIWECEFMLADQNWKDEFTNPTVWQNGRALATQCEKENSNLTLDWRKRVVFQGTLAPSSMNRFDVRLEVLPAKPCLELTSTDGLWHFETLRLAVSLDLATGLLRHYRVDGVEVLKEGAGRLLVLQDDDDPWAMNVSSFRDLAGEMTLLTAEEGSRISGLGSVVPSVRLIEDGPVRSVVEAVFGFGDSFAVVHYKLPKVGTEVEVVVRVNWNEKSRMLKLTLPVAFPGVYRGQTAFGIQDLAMDGREVVAQKWWGVFGEQTAMTVANEGSHGSDFDGREVRLSLLRSAAYCAHPIHDRPLVPQDRYSTRIDQGERVFRFWINAGSAPGRIESVDREALSHNEMPFALSFFPSGQGSLPSPVVTLDDPAVVVASFRPSESRPGWVIRLFEPTGRRRLVTLRVTALGLAAQFDLEPFEVMTLVWDSQLGKLVECDLLERVLA